MAESTGIVKITDRRASLLISQTTTSGCVFGLFGGWAFMGDTEAVGHLALAYTVVTITMGLVRAFLLEPMLLRPSPQGGLSGANCTATGTAVIFASPGVAIFILIAVYGGDITFYVGMSAILMFSVIEDCGRYIAMSFGGWSIAALADTGWLVVQAFISALVLTFDAPPILLLLAFTAGSVVGTAIVYSGVRGTHQMQMWPFAKPSGLGWGLGVEFLAGKGVGDLMVPVVAAVGATPLAGALKLCQLAAGPVNIGEASFRISAMHDWHKSADGDRRETMVTFLKQLLLLSMGWGVICVTLFAVFRSGIPSIASIPWTILAAVLVERILASWVARYALEMRLIGATLVVGRWRVLTGLGTLAAVTGGLAFWGSAGLAIGLVTAALSPVLLWRHLLQRLITRSSVIEAAR